MSVVLYLLILFSPAVDFGSCVTGLCSHLWAVRGRPGRRRRRRPGLSSGGGWRSPGWSRAILRTHEGTGTCAAPSRYRTQVCPLTALTWDIARKSRRLWLELCSNEILHFSLIYCKYGLRYRGKETITIKTMRKPGSMLAHTQTGHTSNGGMQLIRVVFSKL